MKLISNWLSVRLICIAMSSLCCTASVAQSYLFFRLEGPASTPGGPPVQANTPVSDPVISHDGRTLVFRVSSGSNLVNGASGAQIAALSLPSFAIALVSTDSSGAPSSNASTNDSPQVSADGRFVAFETTSSTYTGGVTGVHIVRIDRQTRTVNLVSANSSGALLAGTSARLGGISADGRYVAFSSNAANLVAGNPANGSFSVFVRDLTTMTTERVDVSSSGIIGNGGAFSERPSISADGRYVLFASTSNNLLPTPVSGSSRIYLRDRISATTTQVSIGPGASDLSGAGRAAISANGQFISFYSGSAGSSATQHWFRRLSDPSAIAIPAAAAMGICDQSKVANDARVILQCNNTNPARPFQTYSWQGTQPSLAPALISGTDPNNTIPGNASSGNAIAINGPGTVFAFDSIASNLVSGDSNGTRDVFIYARADVLDRYFANGFED
jgi:hypothetical protein